MLFCRLLIFFQNYYFQKILSQILSGVTNSLDPDQAGQFVGPDLGPNYLQKLPAGGMLGNFSCSFVVC